jgi:hypothetical protein
LFFLAYQKPRELLPVYFYLPSHSSQIVEDRKRKTLYIRLVVVVCWGRLFTDDPHRIDKKVVGHFYHPNLSQFSNSARFFSF